MPLYRVTTPEGNQYIVRAAGSDMAVKPWLVKTHYLDRRLSYAGIKTARYFEADKPERIYVVESIPASRDSYELTPDYAVYTVQETIVKNLMPTKAADYQI